MQRVTEPELMDDQARCSVTGVDGSKAMIRLANARKARESTTGDRVRFIEGLFPGAPIPGRPFAAVISNSLLHHLHEPQVLWETLLRYASPGTNLRTW
jgi:ubiquinone/menaquinone biosynthesis C-methylase UbiE